MKTSFILILLFMESFCSTSLMKNPLQPKSWASYYSKAIQGSFIPYSEGEWFEASLNDCVLTAAKLSADGYSYVPPKHDYQLTSEKARYLLGRCTMLTKSTTVKTYQFNEETWSYEMVYSKDPGGSCPDYPSPDFVGLQTVLLAGRKGIARQPAKGKSSFCLATKALPAPCEAIPITLVPGSTRIKYFNKTEPFPPDALFCSMQKFQCGARVTIYESRIPPNEYVYSPVFTKDATITCHGWSKEEC